MEPTSSDYPAATTDWRRRKRVTQRVMIDAENGVAKIEIIRRSGETFLVVVDLADLPAVAPYTWWLDTGQGKRSPYAAASITTIDGRRKNLLMHRLLLDPPDEAHVDHQNGDGLDNRRVNLRVVTTSQNRFNEIAPRAGTSRFKGVSLRPSRANGPDRWVAFCGHGGKSVYLGTFDVEEDAALAYDDAATHEFGEYAATNFSKEYAATATRNGPRKWSPDDLPHGKSRYASRGCRCKVCTEATRAYYRAYDQRRRRRASPALDGEGTTRAR